jgi:predicted dehydrogenase
MGKNNTFNPERILIVGYGSIGQRHLRIVRALHPSASIAILRQQSGSQVPDGANYCFYNIEDALKFCPDVALIASPATHHLAVAIPLAANGVHMLIEKPISDVSCYVSDFLEKGMRSNSVIAVGYNLRHSLSLKKFKEMLLQNIVGVPWSVRSEVGQFLPSWRPLSDYKKSVSSQKKLGGGVLLELSHEIDYLQWIFGDIDWVQSVLTRQSNLEIDVEDSAHIIIGFHKNAGEHALIGTINMDFIRRDATRICTVIGEIGSLRWDGIRGIVQRYDDREMGWVDVYSNQGGKDDPYIFQWQEFLSLIRGHSGACASGLDGLKVVEVVESIRIAADKLTRIYVKHDQLIEGI